jgi:hypothetical protein
MTRSEIIEALQEGVDADIWYDWKDYDDPMAGEVIQRVQEACREAANMLQNDEMKAAYDEGYKAAAQKLLGQMR